MGSSEEAADRFFLRRFLDLIFLDNSRHARRLLVYKQAVLTEIKSRLWTPTPFLSPKATGEGNERQLTTTG